MKSTNLKMFSSLKYSARIFFIILLILSPGCTNKEQLKQTKKLDFLQVDLMFEFLTELNQGKQDKLLKSCEELLIQLSEGKFKSQDEYERANKLMLGHGYHTIGSIMLSVIDQAGGLEPVKRVIADPGQLLLEYNKAANIRITKSNDEIYIFNETLADKINKLLI